MIRTTRRVARKVRRCDSCVATILPGEAYLEHVNSPDHEGLLGPTWGRQAECAACVHRYGRSGWLLTGVIA